MTNFPFMGKGEHAYGRLDLIHSDVCGEKDKPNLIGLDKVYDGQVTLRVCIRDYCLSVKQGPIKVSYGYSI